MKSFNKKDYSKVIVHCKTQSEWDTVTNIAGLCWSRNHWDSYKDQTGIYIEDNSYTDIPWFEREGGYKIISFEDFMKPFVDQVNESYDIF